MRNSEFNPKSRKSTFDLLGELPGQIIALVKAELDAAKAEFSGKAKNIGLGVGLFVVAAAFVLFAGMVLVATAVIGLALVLPLWLAALLVAIALLLLAFLLALLGRNRVKAGTSMDPDGVTESIRRDVDALKGIGKYEH